MAEQLAEALQVQLLPSRHHLLEFAINIGMSPPTSSCYHGHQPTSPAINNHIHIILLATAIDHRNTSR